MNAFCLLAKNRDETKMLTSPDLTRSKTVPSPLFCLETGVGPRSSPPIMPYGVAGDEEVVSEVSVDPPDDLLPALILLAK
jgi:hypothetical protein